MRASWCAAMLALALGPWSLTGCFRFPGGLYGEGGLLQPERGPEHGFGVARGGTVDVAVRAGGSVAESLDPAVLFVEPLGPGRLRLHGLAVGVTDLRLLDTSGAEVSRFVLRVEDPVGVMIVPLPPFFDFDPQRSPIGITALSIARSEVALADGASMTLFAGLRDTSGRLLLDDGATLRVDGAPYESPVTPFYPLAASFTGVEGESHTIEVVRASESWSTTIRGVSSAVDGIERVGLADELIARPSLSAFGVVELCYVGRRDTATVLGVPLTFAATSGLTLTEPSVGHRGTCVQVRASSGGTSGVVTARGTGPSGSVISVAETISP